jgi:homoserine kinase type II
MQGFVPPPRIVEAYALERATVVDQFESYGNENWLVEGGDGQRYVLRRHHLNADAARIEFQLVLQEHLASRGFPTTAAVATASGERFAIDDGVPWVLFRYVEGEEYDFAQRERAAAAGRVLARFHMLTESLRREAPGPEYKAPLRDGWENAERDAAELRALFNGRGIDDELEYVAGWMQNVLQALPVARLDSLPSGWVHGDFHGRNMVFQGDCVAGVFDFDDVDRGPYAHDIAFGLFKFGREGRGALLRIRPDFARAFVDGYESLRPLTDDERAALPPLAVTGYPPSPRSYRYWRDRGGEDIVQRFRNEVKTMRSLRAQLDQIEAVVRRA